MTTRQRRISHLAISLAALVATASAGAAQNVTFTATLSKEGMEKSKTVTQPTSIRDGFPYLRLNHITNCIPGVKTVCLPAECDIDYSRTYSTNVSSFFASRGFGRGGPGYGVIINNVISANGGSASYYLDPVHKCLTSVVTVCAKLFFTGASYDGYDEIYGKCPTLQPWKKTMAVSPYTLAPGKYEKISVFDPPAGSANGVPGTATTTKWGFTIDSKNPPDAPLQAGMFLADPNVPANGANGPQFWAKNALDNDLAIRAVEVTQGIQNVTNRMPLVGERRTAVRAYLKATLNVGGVRAQLRGSRNGIVLPGSPLTPETEIQGQGTGGKRVNLNDSFLFDLPPSWTKEGAVTLDVDVDPLNLIHETHEDNNTFEEAVQFEHPTAIKVTSVPLHLHPDGNSNAAPLIYNDSQPSFWPILGDLLRFHPVSALLYWDCNVDVQQPVFHDVFGREWDLRTGLDQALLLTRVSLVRALSSCGDSDMHWVGLVHPGISTNNGGSTLGIAVPFGRASWVKMQSDTGPDWSIKGGATLAHELGHNRGLFHINCSGDEGFPVTPLFPHPYPNCRLADGEDGFFGLDVHHDLWGLPEPAVISNDPAALYGHQAFPLMGYKDPNWIDPFHYCRLLWSYDIWSCNPLLMAGIFPDALKAGVFASLSGFGAAAPSPPVASRSRRPQAPTNPDPGPAPEYLMVSGVFDKSTDTVSDLDVQHLGNPTANALKIQVDEPQPDDPGSDEPFLDVVQLRGGTVVDDQSFQLDRLDGIDGIYSFLETIKKQQGVTAVQIRRDGKVVAERRASASPPWIQIITPNNGGALLPGTQMSWASNDPDGDPLTYDVYYSADGGKSWRLLTMGLIARSYKLPARLPGSNAALLRVTARDGFWSTSDQTDATFTVAGSAPRAIILNPNGGIVRLGSTVHLTGLATDLEQGPITAPDRFVWTSDRDGGLGSGQEIATRTLSKGVHQITLGVTDDDGNVGRSSILLYVGIDPAQEVWTPWLNADRPSGVGDFEMLSYFLQQRLACPQPLAIDCRTTSGKNWAEAGQVYSCKANQGGVCVNAQQPSSKSCDDYEVRFLCPVGPYPPVPPKPAQ